MKHSLVPIKPLQRIVEEEIARGGVVYSGAILRHAGLHGNIERLTWEIAEAKGVNVETARGALRRIRTGFAQSHGVNSPIYGISYEWADAVLRAFDREYEWYADPELNEWYEHFGEAA